MVTRKLGARYDFLRKWGVASGWVETQLQDLGDVIGGGTPSRDETRFWATDGIPWATPTDITSNNSKYIAQTLERITDSGLASSAARLLPAQSILFTSRATIGAKAITVVPMATNQGFANFVPKSNDAEYFYYLLDVLVPIIKRLGSGTTFEEVSKRDVRRVWCAVPQDRAERLAIAGVFDAVDASIDRVRQLTRSVTDLKLAFLQRFFYSALGETAYADRPRKSLPQGWQLVPAHELLDGDPRNGISPPASSQPPGVPTFSIAAVRDGRVELTETTHIKYAHVAVKAVEPFQIRKGDVLIVRGNANPDLVGKAGMIELCPSGCIYPDITKRVVFRRAANGRSVTPEFAVIAWNHPVVHNQVLRRAKTSNGTLKINNRDVKQIVVPVPTPNEQAELVQVVAAVDARLKSLRGLVVAYQTLKRSLSYDLLTGRVRIRHGQLESVIGE